jgi:membrane dipeptidase
MDRRRFLVMTGAAAAVHCLAGPARSVAATLPGAAGSIWIDAQGVVDGLDEKDGKLVPSPGLIAAIRQGRIDAVSTTLGAVGNLGGQFQTAVRSIADYDRVIEENPGLLLKVTSAADLRSAKAGRRLGIIYNFQDTTPLETDPDNVTRFAALGVRVMQLTYNKRNLAGDGCLEKSNAGLSDFGRDVIARIEAANVVLDLSHGGQRTVAEAIAASTAPAAISHSGCRALVDFPRNTHDSEMRALADKGGVFGLYLVPFLRAGAAPTTQDLLRHLDHAVRICGEDHVGIGTDNPLTGYRVDAVSLQWQRERYAGRVKAGVAAPGERGDVLTMVEGYNDAARFDSIARDLGRMGWSSARIDKVLGGNFARLFAAVWRG